MAKFDEDTCGVPYRDLFVALFESLKLQKAYAQLLNMYDGGERKHFDSVGEWVERLREVNILQSDGKVDAKPVEDRPLTIHEWFELTRAEYLTIPRSVLQSMPIEWQHKLTAMLEEVDETFDWRPASGRYWVALKDGRGRFVADPLRDYQRGRRRIKPLTDD